MILTWKVFLLLRIASAHFFEQLVTRFRPGKTAGTANNTQDGRDTPRKTTKQQTGRRQPPAGPLSSLLRFLIKTPEQNIPMKSLNYA